MHYLCKEVYTVFFVNVCHRFLRKCVYHIPKITYGAQKEFTTVIYPLHYLLQLADNMWNIMAIALSAS